MTTWHDIVPAPPPDAQPLWLRRAPEDTIPIPGEWDEANARALCGPDGWTIPWYFITHWKPRTTPTPPWPTVLASTSPKWQDLFTTPPVHASLN